MMRIKLLINSIILQAAMALPVSARVAPPAAPVKPLILPSTPYGVTIDGNPREAFLLGAAPISQYDAVSGNRDGSVRAYALATKDGLYVAELSTEPRAGAKLVTVMTSEPENLVLGDWMAVKVKAGKTVRIFCLSPDGQHACLDDRGRAVEPSVKDWQVAGRLFGNTWAGEWLLPWKTLGVEPGDRFHLDVLRGRKMVGGGQALEVLNTSTQGKAASRWGGKGVVCKVHAGFPAAPANPWALASYDVRPFVPLGDRKTVCQTWVPAGEVATAWLACPPGKGPLKLTVGDAPAHAEVFRVDFWWQAGTREEQDALFPARVASGSGDVLVAERLFPEPEGGFAASSLPERFYVRCRIPKSAEAGIHHLAIQVSRDGRPLAVVPWDVTVAPALPPAKALAGAYYFETNAKRWKSDLRDMADHDLTAVTCPAEDQAGWEAFDKEAAGEGLDGTFALHPDKIKPTGAAWAYAADEPASAEAVNRAGARIQALKRRGFRPWAALAWPNSLGLAGELDGVSLSLNLVQDHPGQPKAGKRWIYFQGLRENPFYDRIWAGLVARGQDQDGFWVFCYAPGGDSRTAGDWSQPILRYDACTAPDGKGGRLDTVEWEALREGIVDGRLIRALGAGADKVLTKYPGAAEAMQGAYWKAEGQAWTLPELRRALVEEWSKAASKAAGKEEKGTGRSGMGAPL